MDSCSPAVAVKEMSLSQKISLGMCAVAHGGQELTSQGLDDSLLAVQALRFARSCSARASRLHPMIATADRVAVTLVSARHRFMKNLGTDL